MSWDWVPSSRDLHHVTIQEVGNPAWVTQVQLTYRCVSAILQRCAQSTTQLTEVLWKSFIELPELLFPLRDILRNHSRVLIVTLVASIGESLCSARS